MRVGTHWGPAQSFGMANPIRWTYGTENGAEVAFAMLSPDAQKKLAPTRIGYGNVNTDVGFKIDKQKIGTSPSSVFIRNTITADTKDAGDDKSFSFEGSAATAQPITFTVRDAQIKSGGKLLWSHTFTVQGNWKTYQQGVPKGALGGGRMQYMVIAGHLGAKPGELSLRNIHLR